MTGLPTNIAGTSLKNPDGCPTLQQKKPKGSSTKQKQKETKQLQEEVDKTGGLPIIKKLITTVGYLPRADSKQPSNKQEAHRRTPISPAPKDKEDVLMGPTVNYTLEKLVLPCSSPQQICRGLASQTLSHPAWEIVLNNSKTFSVQPIPRPGEKLSIRQCLLPLKHPQTNDPGLKRANRIWGDGITADWKKPSKYWIKNSHNS
ncbi:hypothetical protein Tco_0571740 [Tanacetum coccineum]